MPEATSREDLRIRRERSSTHRTLLGFSALVSSVVLACAGWWFAL
jgi:hypothetical protein